MERLRICKKEWSRYKKEECQRTLLSFNQYLMEIGKKSVDMQRKGRK